MLDIPDYISLVFILTTFATTIAVIGLSKRVFHGRHIWFFVLALVMWLGLHGFAGYYGFYRSNLNQMPPRLFLFGLFPFIVLVFLLFATKWGRYFMDNLSLRTMTWLSVVRIPVEISLFWLAREGSVPELMSFEGRNFDILAGITAPIVGYLCFDRLALKRKNVLLVWNIIGLVLLLNIIIHAILSAPFPLQQFAFDQPNLAILHFPFVWLAVFVAPVVLLTHLFSLRQLLRRA